MCFGVVTECKSGFLRTKCVHGEVFHIKREQSGARAKGSRQLVKGTRISFTLAHTAHNGHFRPARKARRMIDDGQGGIISERGTPAAATPPFAALTEAGSVLRAALDDIMGRAAAMDDYVARRETELRQMEVEAANEVRRTRKAAETWAADFKRRAEEEVARSAEAAAMQAAASADAKNIENERAVWEAEKQSIAEIQKFDSDVVTINVGGQVFSTYLSTITTGAAADSMLAVLFSGRHSVATDSEGRMFLDQDPVLFADLLTFFRSPLSFSLPDDRRTAIRLLFLAHEYQVTALFDRFAWSETKSARLASQQLTLDPSPSGTHAKDDASPVTIADYAAQVVVTVALRKSGSALPIMGEENADDLRGAHADLVPRIRAVANAVLEPALGAGLADDAEVLAVLDEADAAGGPDAVFWVLDPIDGSKGFLRGDQYAVCLALVDAGEVVAAAVGTPHLPCRHAPSVGAVYAAAVGVDGAWELPLDVEAAAAAGLASPFAGELGFRVAADSGLADASDAVAAESFEASHTNHEWSAALLARLDNATPPIRMDSQAKYVLVARGDAGVYIRRVPGYAEKLWDHASGELLVTAAGGIVTDLHGKPLDWTRGQRLSENHGVLASAPGVHAAYIDACRTLDPSP
ncbi:uncharacterized protein AMSG_12294 [Thecamonas trahens ATCC 50062]|uniref:3'(2'),5'-bisphosphate nucleotidase n=1 Tax=Thecamonas trahens ATCC 50062 TaxID=461836 RepID=A0A0L0DNI8_THETB|nr:hypothetical protein AMSG_12294 [Thecamonas trahens ATCC 50062]KNC53879.1 hypothetical protein AMSG_12294 [Thecamonas trahens ATCC 50062]|eukprot:XP_013754287.1 hypothetical protein AMSG_12294 [Thecamonas trahens ATCC 50062]